MKRIWLCLLLLFPGSLPAQEAHQRVWDFSNSLSEATWKAQEELLAEHENATGEAVRVFIYPDRGARKAEVVTKEAVKKIRDGTERKLGQHLIAVLFLKEKESSIWVGFGLDSYFSKNDRRVLLRKKIKPQKANSTDETLKLVTSAILNSLDSPLIEASRVDLGQTRVQQSDGTAGLLLFVFGLFLCFSFLGLILIFQIQPELLYTGEGVFRVNALFIFTKQLTARFSKRPPGPRLGVYVERW